jgi:hypothetical protein
VACATRSRAATRRRRRRRARAADAAQRPRQRAPSPPAARGAGCALDRHAPARSWRSSVSSAAALGSCATFQVEHRAADPLPRRCAPAATVAASASRAADPPGDQAVVAGRARACRARCSEISGEREE